MLLNNIDGNVDFDIAAGADAVAAATAAAAAAAAADDDDFGMPVYIDVVIKELL